MTPSPEQDVFWAKGGHLMFGLFGVFLSHFCKPETLEFVGIFEVELCMLCIRSANGKTGAKPTSSSCVALVANAS